MPFSIFIKSGLPFSVGIYIFGLCKNGQTFYFDFGRIAEARFVAVNSGNGPLRF